MNQDYIENLAREYNKEFKKIGFSSDTNIENAIGIVEKQLDIIYTVVNSGKNTNKAWLYLESLKKITLKSLIELKQNKAIAECRALNRQGLCKSTLISLQIDLFTSLDYVKDGGLAIDYILTNEMRALGVLGLIN